MSDCELFVGFIPIDVNEEELKSYFESCCTKSGSVRGVRIKRKPVTGVSRCFGFVMMANKDAMEEVLRSTPHSIRGKQLNVAVSDIASSRSNFTHGRSTPSSDTHSAGNYRNDMAPNPAGHRKLSQEPCVGIGRMVDGDRVTPENRGSITVHLNQKDKGRFHKGDRVYLEWNWEETQQIFGASFVTELGDRWLKVTTLLNGYGYLGAPQFRHDVFFPYSVAEEAIGFHCKIDKMLKLGDELHCFCWDQGQKGDKSRQSMKAECIKVPPMVVQRNKDQGKQTVLVSMPGGSFKFVQQRMPKFGVLIELSGDKVQGVLYCAPLGKVLIENMRMVSNCPNIGWQHGDRIIFDAEKFPGDGHFGCQYRALNCCYDPDVRLTNPTSIEIDQKISTHNEGLPAISAFARPLSPDTNIGDENKASISDTTEEEWVRAVPPFPQSFNPRRVENHSFGTAQASMPSAACSYDSNGQTFDAASIAKRQQELLTSYRESIPDVLIDSTVVSGYLEGGRISSEPRRCESEMDLEAELGHMVEKDTILNQQRATVQCVDVGVQTERQQVQYDFVKSILDDDEIFQLIARKHPQMLRLLFVERGTTNT